MADDDIADTDWEAADVPSAADVRHERAKVIGAKQAKKPKPPGGSSKARPKPSLSTALNDQSDNLAREFRKRDTEEDIAPIPDPAPSVDAIEMYVAKPQKGLDLPAVQNPSVLEMSTDEMRTRAVIKLTAYLAAGYSKAAAYSRIEKEFGVSTATIDKYYKSALTELVPNTEEAKDKLRAHVHGMSRKLFKIAVDRKDVKGGVAILDRLSKLFNLDMTPGPTSVVNVGTLQIADLRGDTRRDDFLDRARKAGINTTQAEKLLEADDAELEFDNASSVNATSDMRGQYSGDVVSGMKISGDTPKQAVIVGDAVSELQRYHQEKQGVKVVGDDSGGEKIVSLFPDKSKPSNPSK